MAAAGHPVKSTPSRARSAMQPSWPRAFSEDIMHLIADEVTTFKSKDAVRTLLALCLTAKAFVGPAQRALYRDPLRAKNLNKSWRRSSALLSVLSDKPTLALHVRNTERLVMHARSLYYAADDVQKSNCVSTNQSTRPWKPRKLEAELQSSSDEEVDTPPYPKGASVMNFARKMFLVCIRATHVAVPVSRIHEAPVYAMALSRRPHIISLRFSQLYPFSIQREAIDIILKTTQFGKDLDCVIFEGTEQTHTDETEEDIRSHKSAKLKSSDRKIPDYQFSRLVVLDFDLPLPELWRLLPAQLSALRSLVLTIQMRPDFLVLPHILGHLSLETFVLSRTDIDENVIMFIDDYEFHDERDWEPMMLEDDIFRTFTPSLRRLTINHGEGMQVDFLETLADKSPNVEMINLDKCLWIETDLDHEPGCFHWQAGLVSTLCRFPRLRELDLGWLPSVSTSSIGLVVEYCDEKDRALTWRYCVTTQDGDDSVELGTEDDEDVDEDSGDGDSFGESVEDDGWESEPEW